MAIRARDEVLLDELRREFPGFRLVVKRDSRLHRAIDRALRLISLGAIDQYLDGYHTTIGRTVYVTSDWDARSADARYQVLRHERIHLLQFRRYTRVGMALVYLLVPLPMGLAWCRARLEWEAYAETIRAAFEVGGHSRVADPAFKAHIVAQFTGPAYGWMWPFPRAIARWYDGVVAGLPGRA